MSIRGMLRAAVLLLLIRTWLAEGSAPNPTARFEFHHTPVPDVSQDLFQCKNCASEAVVHTVLERVLTGYDVRLRPNFGGDPIPVGISIYITRIEQISEMNMDYTITMFFHQTWKDPRLAYYETNLNLTLDHRMLDKLWVPDCYFLNSKDAYVHDVTVENRVFQLHPDGTVRYGIKLTTTAACSLDLKKFPLDKQACKLEIESYGYTVEDIILFWEDDEQAIHGTEELHIPDFSFLGKTVTIKEVYFYTGSYMRLILRFQVQREVNSFLVQIYWPTVLTTVLSWLSFWMNCDSSAARVTVGLTSMLILTTIDSHVRNKLPQVSCVKAIDIYIIVCFFFVFFSLMEYVYINYLFYSRGPRRHHRRHRRARRVINRYRYRELAVQDTQPPVPQSPQEEMVEFVKETDDDDDNNNDNNDDTESAGETCQPGAEDDDGELTSMEDDINSLLSVPALARLASPESFSSLSSSPERARLASSESLSSLCSSSSQSSEESLDELSSSSAQALLLYDVLSDIRNRAEARSQDDLDDSSSSDESQGAAEQPLLGSGPRCVQVVSGDLDELCSLPDDASVESGCSSPDENPQGGDDGVLSLEEEEILVCVQEEDSDSESGDSHPLSLGCSFHGELSFKLFNPDYVPKVDQWSRFLFPLAFGLFNIAYWAYHIN
ncbi:gamma-aminobutyric acid receptor subunit theta [Echinops telfairi]|uniref:Gamma-aminobutyric acid receptor subunit theta n=1 Tax=Echinops telfairi TaxID=9371 RepID=A0AC55CML9_ECHTE|nr:gamma-aminobutyric acid receptor subunit theta [Echinops telfairi]